MRGINICSLIIAVKDAKDLTAGMSFAAGKREKSSALTVTSAAEGKEEDAVFATYSIPAEEGAATTAAAMPDAVTEIAFSSIL